MQSTSYPRSFLRHLCSRHHYWYKIYSFGVVTSISDTNCFHRSSITTGCFVTAALHRIILGSSSTHSSLEPVKHVLSAVSFLRRVIPSPARAFAWANVDSISHKFQLSTRLRAWKKHISLRYLFLTSDMTRNNGRTCRPPLVELSFSVPDRLHH